MAAMPTPTARAASSIPNSAYLSRRPDELLRAGRTGGLLSRVTIRIDLTFGFGGSGVNRVPQAAQKFGLSDWKYPCPQPGHRASNGLASISSDPQQLHVAGRDSASISVPQYVQRYFIRGF